MDSLVQGTCLSLLASNLSEYFSAFCHMRRFGTSAGMRVQTLGRVALPRPDRDRQAVADHSTVGEELRPEALAEKGAFAHVCLHKSISRTLTPSSKYSYI